MARTKKLKIEENPIPETPSNVDNVLEARLKELEAIYNFMVVNGVHSISKLEMMIAQARRELNSIN